MPLAAAQKSSSFAGAREASSARQALVSPALQRRQRGRTPTGGEIWQQAVSDWAAPGGQEENRRGLHLGQKRRHDDRVRGRGRQNSPPLRGRAQAAGNAAANEWLNVKNHPAQRCRVSKKIHERFSRVVTPECFKRVQSKFRLWRAQSSHRYKHEGRE